MITCLTNIVVDGRQRSTNTWTRSTLRLDNVNETGFAVRICQFFEDRPLSRSFQVTEDVKMQSKSLVQQGKVKIKFKNGAKKTAVNILCRSAELKMFVCAVELVKNHEKNMLTMYTSHLFNRDGCLVLEWGDLMDFKYYSTSILKMHNQGLKTIDSTVFSLVFLKVVDLSNNDFKELPETIGSLPLLKQLCLANNRLGQGTSWRWAASPIIRKNLVCLDLRKNGMMYVPKEICNLRNLKVLILSRNNLQELPAQIGKLLELRVLDASYNKLTRLPGSMLRLRLLDVDLRQNKFETDIENPTLTARAFILPSLREIVAKYIVQNRFPYWEYILPDEVIKYLEDVSYCVCGGVTFNESCVCCMLRESCYMQSTPHNDIFSSLPFAVQFCSYRCSRLV